MKFAICNETFLDWSLERALELAAQQGFRGWEVAPFMLATNVREFSSQQRVSYRRAVEAAGLEVIGLHWLLAKTTGLHLTSDDAQQRSAAADYLIELARLCADLGGKLMVLGSPLQRNRAEGQSDAEAYANAAEVLHRAVPVLEQTGVTIALEPLGPVETNFMNTAAQAQRLAELVGSGQIALHLDMKAMSSESISIPELIASHHHWLAHFHANDPNRLGPGMGDLDIDPVFAALKQVGYSGWVSVEVFDYSPGVETLVTTSMKNMRQTCEKLHIPIET